MSPSVSRQPRRGRFVEHPGDPGGRCLEERGRDLRRHRTAQSLRGRIGFMRSGARVATSEAADGGHAHGQGSGNDALHAAEFPGPRRPE